MNSSRSQLRRPMSRKSSCRPFGISCHKNTSTRRRRTSPISDFLHGCVRQWWSFLASAVGLTLFIVKPASSNRLFTATSRSLVKTTLATLRNGRLSCLKEHNFVTFRYISTKLGSEVYILLLNRCVKFHAEISTHC